MRSTILTPALALLVLGAWAAPAAAQQRPGGRAPDPEVRLERMKDRLDLTDAQAAEVAAILADAAEGRRAIFDDARDSRDDVRERMRALHETTRDRLSGVLTDEQMERLRESGPRGRPGARHRGGPGRG